MNYYYYFLYKKNLFENLRYLVQLLLIMKLDICVNID